MSVHSGRHIGGIGVLDGGYLWRGHHHANTRPQRGSECNGESRPAHNAYRPTNHSDHAHIGTPHSVGGRRAQILAKTFHQISPDELDLSQQ